MRWRRDFGTRSRFLGFLSLVLCVVISCGTEPVGNAQAQRSEIITNATNPDNSRSLRERASPNRKIGTVAADSDLRYYPLLKYVKYPETVRSLIRRADMENDRCRGIFDSETYRACNRRQTVLIELERNGWCWGGSNTGSEQYWLKCADDPGYTPGQYGPVPYFTEAEINEVANFRTKK